MDNKFNQLLLKVLYSDHFPFLESFLVSTILKPSFHLCHRFTVGWRKFLLGLRLKQTRERADPSVGLAPPLPLHPSFLFSPTLFNTFFILGRREGYSSSSSQSHEPYRALLIASVSKIELKPTTSFSSPSSFSSFLFLRTRKWSDNNAIAHKKGIIKT